MATTLRLAEPARLPTHLLGPFPGWYPAFHDARSRKARENRRVKRERVAIRRRNRGPVEDPCGFVALAIGRSLSRKACGDLRWSIGFRWDGGPVSGDVRYFRNPLTYRGLVSGKHAVLKLFAAKVPRARKLMTGDTKAWAGGTDSKLLALDSAYVEANKEMRGVLRVELDRIFDGWSAVADAHRTPKPRAHPPQPPRSRAQPGP